MLKRNAKKEGESEKTDTAKFMVECIENCVINITK